jgi:EAL domain-containing protein (putative c-di-GMP-specific phosphodiesterase class I)
MATLLKRADSAMYAAKRRGGNHFSFYQSDTDPSVVPSIGLDLWQAIERQQLHLVYQPQVSATGRLHGCEALLRWTHPSLGEISPLKFIPVAETNGAIIPLGDWVLATACRQLRYWQDNGLPELNMSINVSSRQLRDPSFPDRVCQILLANGVKPQFIELEITESEALQSQACGDERLQPLRALGIKIAIDDFGTGYSSLSRLKILPIDRLKIDQSFVRDVATSQDARAISQCFVTMGLAMGKEVVAEGVETSAQWQVLSSQGCHLIQGYFTGRPMAAESLLQWVQDKAVLPTAGHAES